MLFIKVSIFACFCHHQYLYHIFVEKSVSFFKIECSFCSSQATRSRLDDLNHSTKQRPGCRLKTWLSLLPPTDAPIRRRPSQCRAGPTRCKLRCVVKDLLSNEFTEKYVNNIVDFCPGQKHWCFDFAFCRSKQMQTYLRRYKTLNASRQPLCVIDPVWF